MSIFRWQELEAEAGRLRDQLKAACNGYDERAAEVERLRALCWKAARHLRTLPVQSDYKDGQMAAELEAAAAGTSDGV